MTAERLAKFLARAGIASRRKCEDLMISGKVTVNGRVAVEPGMKIDPAIDEVRVNGIIVSAVREMVYLMLNKPAGYVTTVSDTHNRPTVMKLLPPLPVRVYPIGRLDMDTEGLLFFTNDGDFAHAITHPRFQITKVYEGVLKGTPQKHHIKILSEGIEIDGRLTSPAKVEIFAQKNGHAIFKMEIHEGRKRQIRRMWQMLGFPVEYLKRTAVGPVRLGNLPPGSYRYLEQEEIEGLWKAAGRKTGALRP